MSGCVGCEGGDVLALPIGTADPTELYMNNGSQPLDTDHGPASRGPRHAIDIHQGNRVNAIPPLPRSGEGAEGVPYGRWTPTPTLPRYAGEGEWGSPEIGAPPA
jgi:hypothetical protein